MNKPTIAPPIHLILDTNLTEVMLMDERHAYLQRLDPETRPTYAEVRRFAEDVMIEYLGARVLYSDMANLALDAGVELSDYMTRAIATASGLEEICERIRAILNP